MFCIAIVRSNWWISGWDHWWYNWGSYKNTEGFYPTKVPCASSRKAPFYPRNKDVFFKYFSESPEEKSVNRKELCGRLILSWNMIESTYVFLRCFWRSEFALCRTCRDIPKTGSTFYPRPTIGYANCNQGRIHFRQFPTILTIITHLIKTSKWNTPQQTTVLLDNILNTFPYFVQLIWSNSSQVARHCEGISPDLQPPRHLVLLALQQMAHVIAMLPLSLMGSLSRGILPRKI